MNAFRHKKLYRETGFGVGEAGDKQFTISTSNGHAVAYKVVLDDQGGSQISVRTDGKAQTLRAEMHGNIHIKNIIRRLTPTECARIQGFPDKWGHPDTKEAFTDEEYRFWLNVRNTHAAINGKPQKDHSKEQMLTWYNKLWTDSAEYKMWGNGIALPTALYCMQGIEDVLITEMQ